MTLPYKLILSTAALLTLQACQTSEVQQNAETMTESESLITPSEEAADGWKLIWADDFDGTELDRNKWKPEVSCWGGGNEERQCYTDRPENVEVSDGVLRLKAFEGEYAGKKFPEGMSVDPEETETKPYTSGKVRTRVLRIGNMDDFLPA